MTPASDRPEYATGAVPSLDGIRAVAVALVFFAHSRLEKLIPGGLGVTIFFVLSGYLITTLMRTEYARSSCDQLSQLILLALLLEISQGLSMLLSATALAPLGWNLFRARKELAATRLDRTDARSPQ